MDLINEDKIGRAAVERLIEHLKTHPVIIELRNVSVTFGETTVGVNADIKIRTE